LPSIGRAIDFIKCDVEGHELAVLRGAQEVISRCKPAWLVEICRDPDDAGTPSFQTMKFMKDNGYRIFWLDKGLLRERRPGDKALNYFFFNGRHIESARPLLTGDIL
jgi:hypothetical protein